MKSLVFLFAIIALSCAGSTVTPDDLQSVSYMPTQCSELWDNAPYTDSGASRGSRMLAFLKDKGISVYNFELKNDGKIYCSACNCPSGDQVSFNVSAEDYTKLKSITPFAGVVK